MKSDGEWVFAAGEGGREAGAGKREREHVDCKVDELVGEAEVAEDECGDDLVPLGESACGAKERLRVCWGECAVDLVEEDVGLRELKALDPRGELCW